MTIRTEVIAALERQFPCVPIEYPNSDQVIARVNAPNPTIGTLEIHDDGDEVMVCVGNFTHGHFNAFDVAKQQQPAVIAQNLCSFLQKLFTDRVVVWKRGVTGGWAELGSGETAKCREGAESHLWSSSLHNF